MAADAFRPPARSAATRARSALERFVRLHGGGRFLQVPGSRVESPRRRRQQLRDSGYEQTQRLGQMPEPPTATNWTAGAAFRIMSCPSPRPRPEETKVCLPRARPSGPGTPLRLIGEALWRLACERSSPWRNILGLGSATPVVDCPEFSSLYQWTGISTQGLKHRSNYDRL
ncbi:hypothetical protein VTN02DRAFT_6262 [Thermoascus thermophilus]